MSKRVFDFVGALFLLVLFFPIMIFIAVCIKLSSSGSFLFCQTRVGFRGKDIKVYKFRTFYKNELNCKHTASVISCDDPRITPIGKFLRSVHFDELPQICNVLLGDMSLVGPRPKTIQSMEVSIQKFPDFLNRHHVRPGLTGLAQIRGRVINEDQILESVKLDLEYATKAWDMWRDLKILFFTIKVVFDRRGL